MSAFVHALLDGKVNLSIASLPLHLLLAAVPHWYSIYKAEANKVQGGWSNENPRAFVARLNARAAQGNKLSELEELILRGQSAQQNGFEWFPVWAIAVLFGNLARIPKETLDRYTIFYVIMRVVYTYLYLFTKSRSGSYLRTIVFQVSLIPAVGMILKASQVL
ncbi:hypothetical protein AMS68_004361 [Peltaster fructicola]|uniref:Uncharacterized protein n=1 Tax=Peltaster fructicola TaxID=286661 RepID=A0A6H0XVU4_9PEZI|nr:hypothetical protein AMS68_004361 [Peltaster fructicola]